MKELTAYIEQLAEQHNLIRHNRDGQIHFIDASRERMTALDTVLFQPSVILNRGDGYTFSGEEGATIKNKTYQIFIVDHVTDTADYHQIESVFDECEKILDEFFARITIDSKKTEYRFLRTFRMQGIEVSYVENIDNSLYGVMAVFRLDNPYCMTIKNGFDGL